MYEDNRAFYRETELLEKAVLEINRLKPDFVVITGDLVNDPENELQISEFKRIVTKIHSGIPVFLTPGNHDIGMIPDSLNINRYIANYGYDRFSFKHKGFRFIGFNSSLIKFNTPYFEPGQYEWIKKELSRSKRAGHTILFCHYPFFIRSYDEPENYSNIGMTNRKKYLTLFEENKADAIFSGHLHDDAYAKFGEMELFTTSPIGKPHGTISSGLRLVKILKGSEIVSNFYELDEIPETIEFD
jgi:3',5'-cyclic AMP phosphodiesterase CpdA